MILQQSKPTMNKALYPDDWEYLSQGEVHFIVKYVGTNPYFIGKTLRIKKQKNETELERELDTLSSTLFNNYLSKMELLSEYFLNSQIVKLPHQQLLVFFTSMWQKLQSMSKSQKKTVGIDLRSQIQLMDDLTNSNKFKNYTCLIQIKPKSPIYDKYQQKTLSEIAQENNLTREELEIIIQNLPEKYKIQRIKKGIVNDKPHANQIQSCRFFRGQLINYLNKNKSLIEMYFHNTNKIQVNDLPISQLELNQTINKIFHKQDLFNKLQAIIYLYPKSHSRLNGISKENILQMLKNNDYDNFVERLVNQTLQNYDKKCFQQSNNPLDNVPVQTSYQNQLYELLQFLISCTFRDVSIFVNIQIRGKNQNDPIIINEQYSANYKLTILDYQIKSMYRTREKYLNQDNDNLREFVPMILKGNMIEQNRE